MAVGPEAPEMERNELVGARWRENVERARETEMERVVGWEEERNEGEVRRGRG